MQIDTFKEILGDVDRFNTGGGDEIFTPPNIVQDMLDLLPESVWNSKTRFLDICCKSGNFLIEIYNRLDRILSSDNNFKDPIKRRKHILENQIYGICTDSFEEMMIKRRMLGDPFSDNENISTIAYIHPVSGASKQFRELVQLKKYKTQKEREQAFRQIQDALKEKFKQMDFDVVVGNPPYNNDMYLDFVMIGHELAKQFTLMITPAKWQAKGGGQNDLFRKTIVPYMSKIVYYPDCSDIFDIVETDGISYYLIEKQMAECHDIKIVCQRQPKFGCNFYGNKRVRLISKDTNSIVEKSLQYGNLGKKINYQQYTYLQGYSLIYDSKIHKNCFEVLGGSSGIKFGIVGYISKDTLKTLYGIDMYRVIVHGMIGDAITFRSDGKMLGMIGTKIVNPGQVYKNTYRTLGAFRTLDEAKSMQSFFDTKLVRFLISSRRCGQWLTSAEFELVPDPGAFDHIFTDEELYKKYNLTDDEIKLIESVIKERK